MYSPYDAYIAQNLYVSFVICANLNVSFRGGAGGVVFRAFASNHMEKRAVFGRCWRPLFLSAAAAVGRVRRSAVVVDRCSLLSVAAAVGRRSYRPVLLPPAVDVGRVRCSAVGRRASAHDDSPRDDSGGAGRPHRTVDSVLRR